VSEKYRQELRYTGVEMGTNVLKFSEKNIPVFRLHQYNKQVLIERDYLRKYKYRVRTVLRLFYGRPH